MVKQSIDYEDVHHIETEWDVRDDLTQKGYECFLEEKSEEGLSSWQDAWKVFCSIMEQNLEIYTLYEFMDVLDYVYPIDGWLEDYEMELGNAGKYEERVEFCQKVLELFDWQEVQEMLWKAVVIKLKKATAIPLALENG